MTKESRGDNLDKRLEQERPSPDDGLLSRLSQDPPVGWEPETTEKRRRAGGTSPTARSLRELRRRGLEADVVERWIGGGRFRVRKDLFGCWDLAAVGAGELVLVQTTSGSNVSSRIKKIADSPVTPKLREANVRLLVHGWRKNSKGRWVLREEDVS